MRLTEFRTRVAGWEEPCHPGSACVPHNNPLSPTMQPNSASFVPHRSPTRARDAKTPVTLGIRVGDGPHRRRYIRARSRASRGLGERLAAENAFASAPRAYLWRRRDPRRQLPRGRGLGAGVRRRAAADLAARSAELDDEAAPASAAPRAGWHRPAATVAAAIAAAIASPRPRAPRRRAPTRELGDGRRQPGPSSITSIRTLARRRPTPATSTSPPPCSIALAIRLPVAWASRTRSPSTTAGATEPAQPRVRPRPCRPRPPGLNRIRRAAPARPRGARHVGARLRPPDARGPLARRCATELELDRPSGADELPRRPPAPTRAVAAVIGPRSSCQARATTSIRPASPRRRPRPAARAANAAPTEPAAMARRVTSERPVHQPVAHPPDVDDVPARQHR